MQDWINGLIQLAVAPLRTLIFGVRDRLSAIYTNFTNALSRARARFAYWVTRGRAWATAAVRHALVVANMLRWLITVGIPARLNALATSIRVWTLARVAEAVAAGQRALGELRAWAVARLTAALAALNALQRWVLNQVAELVRDIGEIRRHVFGVLGSPSRLALWILAPLIGLLVRYVVDNLERFGEAAWHRRRRLEDAAMEVTVNILRRIL